MKYDDLNIRDKAAIIRIGVKNGFTSIDDIRDLWNSFDEGGLKTHIVQSGEVLGKIASSYGVTVLDILNSNKGLNADKLSIGLKLIIPKNTELKSNTDFKTNGPIDQKELLRRQAYAESTLDPNKYNKGSQATGLYQITPSVLEEYNSRNKTTLTMKDLYNASTNTKVRNWYMNTRLNEFPVNKANMGDSIKVARQLASYNWGPGNLLKNLNAQKANGVDIYDSWDWLKNIPKETRDYVNFILRRLDIKGTGKTLELYLKALKNKKEFGGYLFEEGGELEENKKLIPLSEYSTGNIALTLWQLRTEPYGTEEDRLPHYLNTIPEEEAKRNGWYKTGENGHSDDRVKLESHPSHYSRGTWKGKYLFELTDKGLDNVNYTIFGLNDNNLDPLATLTYLGSIVLPEITVTPEGSYYDNTYDNIKLYSTGGPLYPFSFNKSIPEVRYLNGGNLFKDGGEENYGTIIETPTSAERIHNYLTRLLKAAAEANPYIGPVMDIFTADNVTNEGNIHTLVGKTLGSPLMKGIGKAFSVGDLIDDTIELYNAILNRPSEHKVAPYINLFVTNLVQLPKFKKTITSLKK